MTDPLPWPLADTHLHDDLVRRWSTDRGYHDLTHLREVLEHLVTLGAADDTELVLAAWFHDAVYDDAPAPEERSAALAERLLAHHPVDAREVARLVRVTSHHRPDPDDRRGQLLVDADLAILAAGPRRYADYVAGVRAEYAAVSDVAFARGRADVLRSLLAKPTLFHTTQAQERWEHAARANLHREMAELEQAAQDAP